MHSRQRPSKNVLENYTTYETYFQLGKKTKENPEYAKKQANKALSKYMSLHPHNLRQKTEIAVEHFHSHVLEQISGRAKVMIVAGERFHALRYYFEFDKYIRKMGYSDLGVLVAFSGTVKNDITGELVEYTEEKINKFPEDQLTENFAGSDNQLLLVTEQYQTGFDQPFLHTMYVDKQFSGVKAVQTLSRINRMCRGKTDTFILDFVNTWEEIQKAFQTYYISATVSDTTDPNVVYDMKHFLDRAMLYDEKDIDGFAEIFSRRKRSRAIWTWRN